MMPKMVADYLFAPCGMNCLVCYVHLKDKKPCSGCLGSDVHKPERCKKCEIKQCTHDRRITYCYECDEMPCKRIKQLEKSYKQRYQASLIENSMLVKEIGIKKFMEKEREKWKCAECHGVISLHDKYCTECKKEYAI